MLVKVPLSKRYIPTASKYDWYRVQPSIFGNIFEASIDKEERLKTGAHYTYESDIMRIVEPTILKPWREKIKKAKTLTELFDIQDQLSLNVEDQLPLLSAISYTSGVLFNFHQKLMFI